MVITDEYISFILEIDTETDMEYLLGVTKEKFTVELTNGPSSKIDPIAKEIEEKGYKLSVEFIDKND